MNDLAQLEQELVDWVASVSNDPLAFVLGAFPWGEPGTDVEHETGPDEWQAEILTQLRDGLITLNEAIQIAVASGHGIGKSALVAWIILWAISTMEDTRGIITANTEAQLKGKTWAEVGKWFRICITRNWFELTATALFSRSAEHDKTWRIEMVPWSETRPEAFAGLHNAGKRILLVFDEASAIPDIIWETAEGALTDKDTQIIWVAFGNPTRNTGRFRDCFYRFRHRWIHKQIDSRTVKMSNKAQIEKWIKDHGEDSDFVRIRVRGAFPRAGSIQFIASDVAEAAQKRTADYSRYDPLILGCDVARFGDDHSVIAIRQGRDAKSIAWKKFHKIDTMQYAAHIAALIDQLSPDAVFVDGGGVGGGVVDRLRQLNHSVIEVQFGASASGPVNGENMADKRTEMWAQMRQWLGTEESGGAIPTDSDLEADLTGPEYSYVLRSDKDCIKLESKDSMKARGLPSPDAGDALALTFAYPVARRTRSPAAQGNRSWDYDPHQGM